MSQTIEGFVNMLLKWREAFWSKGLKVNLGKINETKMVSGGIV